MLHETISGPQDDIDEENIDRAELDPNALDEAEIEQALIEEDHPEEVPQTLAVLRGYVDGAIPADIATPSGLSPKRAELARFLEWRRRTASEIEQLEEAHHRAIEALGGERTTKKKIDALIEADVGEVLKFALGGEAITTKKLRAFERHQLEQKLKDDAHAAHVASKALQHIEREISIKTTGLGSLNHRLEPFIKFAVIEAARESDLGERYLRKIAELGEVLLQLLGLCAIVGSHDDYHFGGRIYDGIDIAFPHFGLPALVGKEMTISAGKQAVEKAAAPWQALAAQLVKNPNADAEIGQSA
jgi:hypothetical protein